MTFFVVDFKLIMQQDYVKKEKEKKLQRLEIPPVSSLLYLLCSTIKILEMPKTLFYNNGFMQVLIGLTIYNITASITGLKISTLWHT